jgi:hypothetical protein
VSIVRSMSCLCCSRDLLGTERETRGLRMGPVRADSEWRIACEREGTCSVRWLSLFVTRYSWKCLDWLQFFSCTPCRIGARWYCVRVWLECMHVQCGAAQRGIPRISPAHPSHTHPHRRHVHNISTSIGPDSAKTHGLSLYSTVSCLRPGPHGSGGAASTRALDQIPECSSMIGSVASLTLPPSG